MKKILLLFFIVMLTAAFAVPAMALVHWEIDKGQEVSQEVSMDAYVVYGTWWHATDEPDDDDDADLEWSSWGSSRATVSFTSGKLSGTYQLGFSSDWGQVTTRLIHATYTVNDDMSIQMGKMYAPWFFWGNSRSAGDAGMTGHGAAWDWFDPAVVLRYKGAFIEFMEPVTDDLEQGDSNKLITENDDKIYDVDGDEYEYEYEDLDTDATLPRVYVGYDYSSDGLLIGGALGYNTYKIDGDINETVSAWAAHLHANVELTDMLALRTGGHYAINPAQLHYVGYDDAAAYVENGQVKDATAIAGFVELSAVFGEKTARIGYGYRSFERDDWTAKDDRQTYYAQLVIPIYTNETGASFNVSPEIAVFDEMKDSDGVKEAKSTYIGAVWQIGF